jgi:hypothetical protein
MEAASSSTQRQISVLSSARIHVAFNFADSVDPARQACGSDEMRVRSNGSANADDDVARIGHADARNVTGKSALRGVIIKLCSSNEVGVIGFCISTPWFGRSRRWQRIAGVERSPIAGSSATLDSANSQMRDENQMKTIDALESRTDGYSGYSESLG